LKSINCCAGMDGSFAAETSLPAANAR
jgi:hypothetical protein